AGPALDALAGMLRLAGDESLVTLPECPPGDYRGRVGHGAHCARGWRRAMTVSAAELLGGDDIARRALHWCNPSVRAGLMPTEGRRAGRRAGVVRARDARHCRGVTRRQRGSRRGRTCTPDRRVD